MRRFSWHGAALALLAALALGGCAGMLRGIGGNLGGGAAAGAGGYLSGKDGQAAVRTFLYGSTKSAAGAVDKNLTPVLSRTLDGTLGTLGGFLLGTRDSLHLFLRGPLRDDVNGLIASSGATLRGVVDSTISGAGAGLRTQWSETLALVSSDAETQVTPLAARMADQFAARLASRESGFRQAIDTLVATATTSALTAADGALQGIVEREKPRVNRTLWMAGGILGTVLAVCVGLLFLAWRRSVRALEALGAAVKSADPDVQQRIKSHVKTSARERRIEGYLISFLQKRDLLAPSAPDASRFTVPVPPNVFPAAAGGAEGGDGSAGVSA